MSRARAWLAGAAIAAAGFWLGTTRAATPAPAPAAAPIASAPVRAVPVRSPVVGPPGASSVTADQIRAIVRDELAEAGRADAADAAGDRADAPASPVPDADQAAAVADAVATVDAAVAAGRWTDADVARLRAALPRLGRAELDRVLGPLFVAINDRRVVVDGALL